MCQDLCIRAGSAALSTPSSVSLSISSRSFLVSFSELSIDLSDTERFVCLVHSLSVLLNFELLLIIFLCSVVSLHITILY